LSPRRGRGHKAWGFNPRNEPPNPIQSPEGAQAAQSDPLAACAPSGLPGMREVPVPGVETPGFTPAPPAGAEKIALESDKDKQARNPETMNTVTLYRPVDPKELALIER